MQQLTQLSVAAIVEAGVLCALSYFLFVAGQRLIFARPGRLGWVLWHLVRLPGNLVHELSHALVLTLMGFRVRRVQVSLFDREHGRGAVYVEGQWHRLVWPEVRWALGAVAPLFGGVAALVAIAHFWGAGARIEPTVARSVGEALVQRAAGWLATLDFHRAETYLLLWLTFSIAAELAPSENDLRSSLRALAGMACALVALSMAVSSMPPTAPARQWFEAHVGGALVKVMAAQEMALSVICGVGLVVAAPVLLMEALRAEERKRPASVVRATHTDTPRRAARRQARMKMRRAASRGWPR